MKIDGTYPGALLSFVDEKLYTSSSTMVIEGEVPSSLMNSNGWIRGPAIVCASFRNVLDESGANQIMYVLSAETIGWVDVDRSRKSVEYIMSAPDTI
jgi:hypothetical protein